MTQVWVDDKVVPVTVVQILKEKNVDGDFDINSLKEIGKVSICGTSKGKGFQGVVKRHGFAGGPASHGGRHNLRAPGSIGSTDAQRVFPGRKMPGRTGGQKQTVKNLKVISVHPETNEVFLKGAIPGMRGSELEIKIK